MEKRVVVFLVASAALLFGWMAIQQHFFPPPAPEEPPPTAQATPGTPPAAPATPSPAQAAAPTGSARAPTGSARPPEERVAIDRPGLYHAEFTTWGAAPVEMTLLNPQYQVTVDGKNEQINMVKKQAGLPPYLTWLSTSAAEGEGSDVDLAPDAAWKLERRSGDELVYSADAGDLHLEKRWTFPPSGYQMGLALQLSNRGGRPVRARVLVSVDGWHDPSVKAGGWTSFGRRVNLHEAQCEVGEKLKHQTLEPLLKSPERHEGDIRWIGAGQQFFVMAAAFKGGENRVCHLSADGSGRLEARVALAEKTVGPGETLSIPMAAFVGPKLLRDLQDARVDGEDPHLEVAVDYTLGFLARPMFRILEVIHRVVRNWGVAIIVITVLLKLVMLYPTQQSMKSAKSMAKLKPEMDAIKARWPNDKVKQSEEQQKLFKKHGISPLGGCLPALLQMPIYIAFYSMLSNAVELYRSSFVGPIRDMTEPFPAMAVATGALMFVQQLTSPQAGDPQQRQMMYMMPVMFMVFTLFLPSGLTLYILTNTLLTMVHQWWLNRHDVGGTPARPPRRAPA